MHWAAYQASGALQCSGAPGTEPTEEWPSCAWPHLRPATPAHSACPPPTVRRRRDGRWLLRRVPPSAVARSSGTKRQLVGVRLKGSRSLGQRVPAARQQCSSTRLRRAPFLLSTLWELRGVSTSIGSQAECFFSSFLRALLPSMQGTHARCRRPTEPACSSAAHAMQSSAKHTAKRGFAGA